MSFAEVTAVDAESSSSTSFLSLFVHCSHTRTSCSSSESVSPSIHIQLVDPPTLYEADVASCHKPRALDCSGAEYLAAVESALIASSCDQPCRFEFRWSKQKRSLTLMERAEFAVKFCAIEFQVSKDLATWQELLHQIATRQREDLKLIVEKQSKMEHCETLLRQKDVLLETALTAKQQVEDELFVGFCAVLNAKKNEIRRLQFEVQKAQEMHKFEMESATKKRKVAAPKRNKKVTGAKLRRKVEKEEEDDDDEAMSDESNGSHGNASEEEEDERERAKNDAIKAYGALPTNLRSSSVQISSAEDLLSSMDEIIKNEEEKNEATQRGDSRDGTTIMAEPVASKSHVRTVEPSTPWTRKTAALKVEPTPAPKPESKKPLRVVSQVDEAMDPEEEDILDMLS
ncbi:unnamed protein product [Peronospora belbahrii]|uniref:DNA repair protein XRCC4 n=1 Tax=Peronospora belbahrii TaxID=622444 RepID=A0AAU9L8S9_9STRA|nr:unnamed protein product [Peronospora belbahrii]CAH0520447.1 unnamed protein product [Peronospora belbahrii]